MSQKNPAFEPDNSPPPSCPPPAYSDPAPVQNYSTFSPQGQGPYTSPGHFQSPPPPPPTNNNNNNVVVVPQAAPAINNVNTNVNTNVTTNIAAAGGRSEHFFLGKKRTNMECPECKVLTHLNLLERENLSPTCMEWHFMRLLIRAAAQQSVPNQAIDLQRHKWTNIFVLIFGTSSRRSSRSAFGR